RLVSDWSSDVCSSDLLPGDRETLATAFGRSGIFQRRAAELRRATGRNLPACTCPAFMISFSAGVKFMMSGLKLATRLASFTPEFVRHPRVLHYAAAIRSSVLRRWPRLNSLAQATSRITTTA